MFNTFIETQLLPKTLIKTLCSCLLDAFYNVYVVACNSYRSDVLNVYSFITKHILVSAGPEIMVLMEYYELKGMLRNKMLYDRLLPGFTFYSLCFVSDKMHPEQVIGVCNILLFTQDRPTVLYQCFVANHARWLFFLSPA